MTGKFPFKGTKGALILLIIISINMESPDRDTLYNQGIHTLFLRTFVVPCDLFLGDIIYPIES